MTAEIPLVDIQFSLFKSNAIFKPNQMPQKNFSKPTQILGAATASPGSPCSQYLCTFNSTAGVGVGDPVQFSFALAQI